MAAMAVAASTAMSIALRRFAIGTSVYHAHRARFKTCDSRRVSGRSVADGVEPRLRLRPVAVELGAGAVLGGRQRRLPDERVGVVEAAADEAGDGLDGAGPKARRFDHQ